MFVYRIVMKDADYLNVIADKVYIYVWYILLQLLSHHHRLSLLVDNILSHKACTV